MTHVSLRPNEASQTSFNPQTLFRNVLRTSLDAVFVSAPGGRLIDCNEAALALLGYDDREELKAVLIDDLCADPASRRGLTRAVEETGLVERYPVTLRRKDGSTVYAMITSAAMAEQRWRIRMAKSPAS